MLGELGAETVSADGIVHELLAGDAETVERVADRFGKQVRGGQGIDRKALGREVFGDRQALRDLEGILHPLVWREIERRAEISEAPLFVAEVPLLFEGSHAQDFDATVAVVAPRERRLAWARERGVGEAQFSAIESRQLSGEEKARCADLVVQNDGGLDRLREQARKVWQKALGGGPGW
jgi:dephospho-CoA kinase